MLTSNFKGALWTFKQWSALKMRVRCEISIVLLLKSSCGTLSGYEYIAVESITRPMEKQ